MTALVPMPFRPDGELEHVVVELAAGVDLAHAVDDLAEGDAAAVVADGDHGVLLAADLDDLALAHDELVDAVVDDFLQENVDAVHAGWSRRRAARCTCPCAGGCAPARRGSGWSFRRRRPSYRPYCVSHYLEKTCKGQERGGCTGCAGARRRGRGQQPLRGPHHVPPVRPPPVRAQAAGAAAEAAFASAHRGRHGVRGRGQRLERGVAEQAAGKRSRRGGQVETAQHLDRLFLGPHRSDAVAAGDEPSLEQPTVAREQNASLARGAKRELGVAGQAPVLAVEPEHSQQPCQRAEVRVEQEAEAPQRRRPHLRDGRDVEALEDGVDADQVSRRHEMVEPYGHAVHEHEIDFGVGDAQVLDQVEDGARLAGHFDRPRAHRRRQEVVELLVEADRHGKFRRKSRGPRIGGLSSRGRI